MVGEMPRAYFISYFSALGMEPVFLILEKENVNSNIR